MKEYLRDLKKYTTPYLHYDTDGGSLPNDFARELTEVILESAPVANNYTGTRADYENSRVFLKKTGNFSKNILSEIDRLDSATFKSALSDLFNVDFSDTKLRIELVEDVNGFFQIPHLDVEQKKITWITYLGNSEDVGQVGTDVFDSEKNFVKSSKFEYNNGFIFFPGVDTWHGFSEGKTIKLKRRVLIINYVDNNWRDVHELV